MASQTTEVCEKNVMNLELTTPPNATETMIQTAATAAGAFVMNKDHYNDVDVDVLHEHHDSFANEKANPMKTEYILPTIKDIQGITNTIIDTTNTNVNTDTDVNSSSALAMSITNEKKNVQIEELQSDSEDANVSGDDGCGDGGGLLTAVTAAASENDIGSSPNSSRDHDNNIPEWKKELLQRRRTKIARTIGANQISSICNKKDVKLSTSPVVSLSKTLTTNNSSSNTNKNSSHQITNNNNSKLLPTATTTTAPVTTNTHQMIVETSAGANQNQLDLDCSTSGHYHCTTVNSLQYSCAHQPQQICGIENLISANTTTSLEETKSTSFSTLQSSSLTITATTKAEITTPSLLSNPTLKNSEFNNSSNSNSSSDSNNQSFTIGVESGLKCGSNNNSICISDISNNTNTNSINSSCSSNNGNGSSNFSGTCRFTSQSTKQQNQLEQIDSVLVNTSSSPEQLQQQQPFQLHSRHENVKTSTSCSIASPPIITASLNVTFNNCNNTNNIINNNSTFVKNPSVGKTSLNKASKYKLSAKLNSLSSSGSAVTSSQTKKMVAMQQIEVNDTSAGIDLDFDPSEELQYGPGIVSKLRCRYLSLALRQSAGKQRPPLDNLRRATSLNNLLDDDDDSNNGSVVDHVDHIENNVKNIVNNSSSSVTTPDEFVANFQKNLKISEKDKQRSRHLKRGNDSLKRARSVEALLCCDKSWDQINNTVNNGGSIDKISPPTRQQLYHHRLEASNNVNSYDHNSISSAAEVTIEDKIIHAKERILCEKTPKRLTSIIDDTERPPPDVVKQTLKIFEATANRRGRGLSRNNCSGEVAAKVATYKSIISQEKPPIIFPKPPLSPKRQYKKPGSLDIATTKRNTTINNSVNVQTKKINPTSPISNLAKKFTNLDAFSDSCEKNSLTQAPNQGTTSPSPSASGGHRAEVTLRHRHNFMTKNESTPIRSSFDSNSNSPSRTPDLIPRKHFDHSLFTESLSPVTQLTKNIEKLKIESPQPTTHSLTATQTNSSGNVNPVASSLVTPQRQNSEPNDSSDVSDVEEQIKQVSKTSPVTKNILYKSEVNQENNLNKSSSSCLTSSLNKPSLAISVNGNSLTTTGSCSSGGGNSIDHHHTQQGQQQQQQQAISIKQVCVIRPLLAESKLSQHIEKLNSSDNKIERSEKSELLSTIASDTLNANKTRDNLVISNLSQTTTTATATATSTPTQCSNLINLNQSGEQQQQQLLYQRPALTSREIEKNLINEKKNEQAAMEANSGGVNNKWPFMKKKSSSPSSTSSTLSSSLGTSSWNQQMAEAQNNSMVFNFKDRKEVPDYIENDGLLVKRRRELPKPNEPGFVLLGDLSLETSTDPDDSWTMGPPSPCDVEFENANIIIDGKSSIRYKAKDISLKVQFDDTLTSTFEYPSESSLLEESPSTFETAITTEITAAITQQQPTIINQHGKINDNNIIVNKAPGQKLLGNMTLGSAPLGSYTPIKAQINTTFELGITRAPTATTIMTTITNDGCAIQNLNTTNGNTIYEYDSNDIKNKMNNTLSSGVGGGSSSSSSNSCTQQNGGNNSIFSSSSSSTATTNKNNEFINNEPDSLPYLKPATDDHTIVYSEGSQKTDLLY